MHCGFSPGDVLRVRGGLWLLQSVTTHADCSELELDPAESDRRRTDIGDSRVVLLTPFDRPERLTEPGSPRVVSRRSWMAGLRRAVLRLRGPGTLVAPVRAAIDLLPHQLEPAMAVVHHGATRLLLADAVGLGKTIEAALVLAELRTRGELERALILTPPGLRDQWAAELRDRFAMDATVADAAWLRTCRLMLPSSVNPWSVPGVLVTSFDFAKRPEVVRSIEEVSWDAVVLDEAHLAAGDSDRRAAAHAIASRARRVLLLTATPHSGDAQSYQALCRIGSLAPDDPIVIFRHDRTSTGLNRRRRVFLHHVRSTPDERAVRQRLDDYVRRVWTRRGGPEGRDARLAMMVLLKRSFSGMTPLRQSLLARRGRLGGDAAPGATQLALAWDDDSDAADEAPADVLAAPGLDDVAEERATLGTLAELARAAEADDSKLHALRRLFRRTQEPMIVFTEYRDTLGSLQDVCGEDAGVLHGALDRAERAAVLYRFASGGLRVLLATDAAGEGLNLQNRCRLVVNLELPWNPMRLEQRIGRVDRIGQRREVHAINMIAAGTAEASLLARLVRRLDRARAAIGSMEDVLGQWDEDVVSCQLGPGSFAPGIAPSPSAARAPAPVSERPIDVRSEALDLAAHLGLLRRMSRAPRRRDRRQDENVRCRTRTGILVTAVRCSRLRHPLRRTGVLAVFRLRWPAQHRRAETHALVPVFAECPCPPVRHAREARERADAFIATWVPLLARAVLAQAASLPPVATCFDRDAHLAARASRRPIIQRGLFDRRAEREAQREADAQAADGAALAPAREGESGAAPSGPGASDARGPDLELLLFVTS